MLDYYMTILHDHLTLGHKYIKYIYIHFSFFIYKYYAYNNNNRDTLILILIINTKADI